MPSPTATMEKVPDGVNVPLVRKGRLTVCQWRGGTPYLSATAGGTKAEGFDVELLTLVAERLGVVLLIIESDQGDVLAAQALGAKSCDLSAGRFYALPEDDPDQLPVDYTVPYFRRTTAILSSDTSLTSLESLRGKRVAIESSGILPDEVAAAGVQTVELDGAIIPAAIHAGRFDAAILDSGVARYAQLQDKSGAMRVTHEFGEPGDVVFAVANGNTVLREQVNAALVDAGRNGHYHYAYRQWFAGEPTLVPGS
ncbi:substrate-binding periplasmic protein [Cryptosporangium minutisporangium]|uniref:substrate-binding periplasmic protein n=1 Tax=Cryptosporangium minutisporangium TaxID=113569 RepID=UPI0031E6BC51